ncbi:MAG: hypothetical protein ACRD2T_14825, partial [Thermoanaerobaculia bacterium]
MASSPGKRSRRHRRLLAVLGGGALATLSLLGVYHRSILASIVTRMALADARKAAAGLAVPLAKDSAYEPAMERLAARHGTWFRRGLLDRDLVAAEFPASGLTPEALPALLVAGAFYVANEARYKDSGGAGEQAVFAEFLLWLDPALRRSSSRELLVNLLTGDYTLFSAPGGRDGGGMKSCLFT